MVEQYALWEINIGEIFKKALWQIYLKTALHLGRSIIVTNIK